MKPGRLEELETYADGEIIVREGDESQDMYVVHRGEVEVLKQVDGRDVPLATLGRGAFFGEMSMLEALPRSATVRAKGGAELLVIRSGSLLLKIRRDPTFAFEMLQQMSHRIRELNERFAHAVEAAGPASGARALLLRNAVEEYRPSEDGAAGESRAS